MHYKIIAGLLLILQMLCTSCNNYVPPKGEIVGMKPVYTQSLDVTLEAPKGIINQGKIVDQLPFLFINDLYAGIHIIDNTDPTQPEAVHFLSIPGNIDFSVQGNVIYANSYTDLVVIQFNGFESVEEVVRIDDHYESESLFNNIYPINYWGYFECYDESKGFISGWTQDLIQDPRCFR